MNQKLTKRLLAVCLTALTACMATAQEAVEGTSYYLPKTALRFSVLVERTDVTPGELCMYAERYMKKNDVAMAPSTAYRIVGATMTAVGVRDTSKLYTAAIDSKHNLQSLKVGPDGVILSVNAEPAAVKATKPFVAQPQAAPLNPRDYMTEEILTASSTAKTAELTAREIYDIRESRSLLSKGQADFMPKDGEQMRLMLRNLDMQETALLQLFEGVTRRDTTETVLTYVPEKETSGEVLFRFSQKLGMVDADDLSGTPYYIYIEDLHQTPASTVIVDGTKKNKDDANIYATLPGKVRVTLKRGTQEVLNQELYAGQFGLTAPVDTELFGKKLLTSLVYNPITGALESIKTEMVKK